MTNAIDARYHETDLQTVNDWRARPCSDPTCERIHVWVYDEHRPHPYDVDTLVAQTVALTTNYLRPRPTDADAEARTSYDDGYDRGFAQGYSAGFEEGEGR